MKPSRRKHRRGQSRKKGNQEQYDKLDSRLNKIAVVVGGVLLGIILLGGVYISWRAPDV